MKFCLRFSTISSVVLLAVTGCSGEADVADDSGGSSGGIPGAAVGGTSAGGTSAVGGMSAGGNASGGNSTGGSASGGTDSGGGSSDGTTSSGGSASGGSGGGDENEACPPGITQTITVAKSGGQFSTVQAAINSIASGSSAHIRINIASGTYYEQVKVENRTNLCLVGAGAESTILTYDDSAAKAQTRTGSTVNGYSFTVNADDFSAAHLSFENTCVNCGQATALGATAQRSQFLDCRVLGMQDTLYVKKGTQYFRDCFAEGNVDFIFGAGAAAFENCEMHSRANGVVVAPNTDITSPYGIVFFGGELTAEAGVASKSVALGRPWEKDGAAVYLQVKMGAHIESGGFVAMEDRQPQNARFGEYQSTGTGANAAARSGYQLSSGEAANYTLAKMFPSWTPSYSK